MTIKRAICASTLAAGVGLTGLFGVGLGTASADPWGPGCNNYGGNRCGDDHRDHGGDHRDYDHPGPVDWHNRGFDQGRFDHQPFNYYGRQVFPVPAGNGFGWGFWLDGRWIPL